MPLEERKRKREGAMSLKTSKSRTLPLLQKKVFSRVRAIVRLGPFRLRRQKIAGLPTKSTCDSTGATCVPVRD
jgi:hypothetical protein